MESNGETTITDFKRYLLGSLPPPETEAVDLQIIADEDSEEKLLWAESELIEDYLDETLSPPEVEAFEKNFLVTPERRAQLRQISLVRNYALRAVPCGVAAIPGKTPASESLIEKLKNYFSVNWRLWGAVTALLLVGAFAVFYLTANRQTAAEKEFAALNQKDLSNLAELEALTDLSLTDGIYRNSGGAGKLAENRLTERNLFRLDLPVSTKPAERFKAELVKDGKVVFTLDKLPFYQNPHGREVRLLLPASALKKGAYQINLTQENAPESIFVYHFAVE